MPAIGKKASGKKEVTAYGIASDTQYAVRRITM